MGVSSGKRPWQNSIAPENSLPQLGQVCLVCVLILTTLQPQTRPSSNTTLAPSGAKAASTEPGKLLSCCKSNRALLYPSASNHVSKQDSYP